MVRSERSSARLPPSNERQHKAQDKWQALPLQLVHEVGQHVRIMLMF